MWSGVRDSKDETIIGTDLVEGREEGTIEDEF